MTAEDAFNRPNSDLVESYKEGIRRALERHVPKGGPYAKKIAGGSLLGIVTEVEETETTKRSNWNEPTKRFYERLGYSYRRVDSYDSRTNRSHDFLGFGDGLALKAGEPPIVVQLTSKSSMSARIKKIYELKQARCWLETCSQIEVIGWEKVGGKNKETRKRIHLNDKGEFTTSTI